MWLTRRCAPSRQAICRWLPSKKSKFNLSTKPTGKPPTTAAPFTFCASVGISAPPLRTYATSPLHFSTKWTRSTGIQDSTTLIGVPKEIKSSENRVALTPAGAYELVRHGHKVFVQESAGVGSGFSDSEYVDAGATLLPTIEEVYATANMIMKVCS